MGDCVELTTWPTHEYLFYKVTSGAMSFEVKCAGNAAIGLATKSCKIMQWIYIDGLVQDRNDFRIRNRNTWIEDYDSDTPVNKVENTLLLDANDFTKFWLSWKNGEIRLGMDSHGTRPIISGKSNYRFRGNFYVTFGSLNHRNVVFWKLHLPPKLSIEPLLKPISRGAVSWKSVEDQLPDDTVIGGFENETLYIIRAHHQNSLTPGKFVPSEGAGYIAWGGEDHEKNDFEVLCGFDCKWVSSRHNEVPENAIEGGYSENTHEVLYIGRVHHEGHLIPGKVQPSHKVCYIPYKGFEIAKEQYEILVCPNYICRSENNKFVSEEASRYNSEDDEEEDLLVL